MLNPSLRFWYLDQSWASSSTCLSIYRSVMVITIINIYPSFIVYVSTTCQSFIIS